MTPEREHPIVKYRHIQNYATKRYIKGSDHWAMLPTHRGGSRGGGGGGGLGAEAPPFIFRLYLINMLSIIMKFCLSIIV